MLAEQTRDLSAKKGATNLQQGDRETWRRARYHGQHCTRSFEAAARSLDERSRSLRVRVELYNHFNPCQVFQCSCKSFIAYRWIAIKPVFTVSQSQA